MLQRSICVPTKPQSSQTQSQPHINSLILSSHDSCASHLITHILPLPLSAAEASGPKTRAPHHCHTQALFLSPSICTANVGANSNAQRAVQLHIQWTVQLQVCRSADPWGATKIKVPQGFGRALLVVHTNSKEHRGGVSSELFSHVKPCSGEI